MDHERALRSTLPSDDDVVAVVTLHVETHQVTMKYAALIDALVMRDGDRDEWNWLYVVVGPITRRLKNQLYRGRSRPLSAGQAGQFTPPRESRDQERLVFIKGRGAGWTIPSAPVRPAHSPHRASQRASRPPR